MAGLGDDSWMSLLCMAASTKLKSEECAVPVAAENRMKLTEEASSQVSFQEDEYDDADGCFDETAAAAPTQTATTQDFPPQIATEQQQPSALATTTTRPHAPTPQPPVQQQAQTTVQLLRGINAVSKRDVAWNVMFRRLQLFKLRFGHCNVPQGYNVDMELGTWVKNQRQAYRYMLEKRTTKRISPDRVTILNHVGFEWRKYSNMRSIRWSGNSQSKQARANVSNEVVGASTTKPVIPPATAATTVATGVACEAAV